MGDGDGEPKPVRRTDDPNPHPGGGRRRRKPRRGGRRRREDNQAVRMEDRGSRIEDGRSKITPPARSSIQNQASNRRGRRGTQRTIKTGLSLRPSAPSAV